MSDPRPPAPRGLLCQPAVIAAITGHLAARSALGQRIRSLHRRLATVSDDALAREAELKAAWASRDALDQELGVAIGRSLDLGLRVAVEPATDVAPRPAEVAAVLEAAPSDEEPVVEHVVEEAVDDEVLAPAPVEAPPPIRARPASAQSLQQLIAGGIGCQSAGASAPTAAPPWILGAGQLLDRLPALDTLAHDPGEASSLLVRALDLTALATWPTDAQRAAIDAVVTTARALQTLALSSARQRSIDKLFSTLTRYSKEQRPGMVHGLARAHQPQRASWLDDARRARRDLAARVGRSVGTPPADRRRVEPEVALAKLERALAEAASVEAEREAVKEAVQQLDVRDVRLLKLVAPLPSEALHGSALKRLRRALRDHLEEGDDAAAGAEASGTDPHPGLLALTHGRKAVIVGGEKREAAVERTRQRFGFAEVEWLTPSTRRLDSLSARIRGGSVDVVILLRRFCPHEASHVLIPAIQAAPEARWVNVDEGYGVVQIEAAMMRFWADAIGEQAAAK